MDRSSPGDVSMRQNAAGYESRRDRHAGWYYHQHRRQRQQKESGQFQAPTVKAIFSRNNLFCCFQQLKHEAGQAPGIDGVRYDQLSPSEAGTLSWRSLSQDSQRPVASKPNTYENDS